ncbi:hypothetical protein PR202_gb14758 [Eleusine coracana subsp. coracana]|uniref:Cyclin n=1 Tax=Eleusine coracana subsp. coracana TaxID=191504 RepID=A0AAV5EWG5_ELECO|nr:hypothetical protein QOZ80_4BG0339180 [Eleusine coracana subsp. coracana]GJN26798.1 hypothetical protein PR202_gb14758 [Eleusine coracana subsp. coracana]
MASSSELLSSDAFAFPCRDDGTPTALSPPVVISVLASILERHIALNEKALLAAGTQHDMASDDDLAAAAMATRRRAAAFDSGGTELDMSLREFLDRFHRYAEVSPAVYVVAYAYLDRLRRRGGGGVRVVRANAQRLLTAAILVASKFVEDRNYKNSHFAAVGGIGAAELGRLELDFLFLMEFRLNVCATVFRSYCRHLEREVSFAGRYGGRVQKPLVCAGEARARQAQHRQAAAAQ